MLVLYYIVLIIWERMAAAWEGKGWGKDGERRGKGRKEWKGKGGGGEVDGEGLRRVIHMLPNGRFHPPRDTDLLLEIETNSGTYF